MAEPHEPAPKKYALKEATYERVEPVPGTAAPSPEHDVFALLKDMRQREADAGLDTITPAPEPRRRRRRDYLVLLVAGNGFMLTVFLVEIFVGFQVQCLAARMPGELNHLIHYAFHDGRPMFFLPAVCMTAYSGALTWLMFGVMGRY